MLAPGEQDTDIRVQIGNAPGNSLSLELVERVLTLWHKAEPEVMGEYIAEAITGVKPRGRARRAPRDG